MDKVKKAASDVPKAKLGSTVWWKSQAQGMWKTKTGKVIAVVAALEYYVPKGWRRNYIPAKRIYDRYVVDVDGKLYSPRCSVVDRQMAEGKPSKASPGKPAPLKAGSRVTWKVRRGSRTGLVVAHVPAGKSAHRLAAKALPRAERSAAQKSLKRYKAVAAYDRYVIQMLYGACFVVRCSLIHQGMS